MTIKRKTQLNLSGSHRNLDADFAHIGSALFVTGSVSGSTGRFTYLSGALSASSTGLPFIVAGSNITANWSDTNLNWTITGSGGGGSVAGSDTQVQFNENGAFAASSSFTHTSGTLGVHAISGSLTSSGTVFGDIQYNGNILKINTNVLVTQSVMVFDGVDSALNGFGGVILANNAQLNMFSGSLSQNPPFGINPSSTPDQVQVNIRGELNVNSGSLHVNSGSFNDQSFTIEPSITAARVNVIFDRTGSIEGVPFMGINIRPLYSSMTTGGSAGTIMSGSLLSFNDEGPNTIGKIDFNVTAVQKNTDNYGSWTFSTTVAKDTAGATSVIAYSELDAATSGSDAATWDVNINSNAVICCTGSAGAEIQWYAHVTKKMFLSGSGLITY